MSGKTKQQCYHCRYEFIVSKRKGKFITLCVVGIVLVIFNLIILYSSKNINFPIMITVNVICVFICFLISPFTAKFHPVKLTKSEKRKLNPKENK